MVRVLELDLSKAIRTALRLAHTAHSGQTRRDGVTPYTDHLKAVSQRLWNNGERSDVIQCAAWLHDVIEDTQTTVDDLRKEFAEDVVAAVCALTKRPKELYENYLERVKSNEVARKVKVADMLCNLADSPTDKQVVKYAMGLLILCGDWEFYSNSAISRARQAAA